MASVDSEKKLQLPSAESSKAFQKKSIKDRTLKDNFKQQTLPAWQPIFTAGRISPLLFIIGLLFVPSGIGIWLFSNSIKEVNISYTECRNTLLSVKDPEDFNKSCADVINDVQTALNKDCKCRLQFNLTQNLQGPVYIYYALTNFYQNHRKYLVSRDDKQLNGGAGDANDPKEPSDACKPYDREPDKEDSQIESEDLENVTTNETRTRGRIYLPCGAIANSMFSDEIKLFHCFNSNEGANCSVTKEVPLNRTGISWRSDQERKFNNPCWFNRYHNDTDLKNTFAKPRAWRKELWELDPENEENNGLNNEDLIVWMRVAALPDFRKLFRIVNQFDMTRQEFQDGLPVGSYVLEIDYHYPVKSFHGTKTIILSTTSILGASNAFLGIAYVVAGTVCLILGVFLLFVHVKTRDLNRKTIEPQKLHLADDTQKKVYYGT